MKDIRDAKQAKGKRGGAVKKAPPGYYTAGEAQKKLGLNASTFSYYVRRGKIKKHVPPLRKEGFYEKKEIDMLANEVALFLHTTDEETTMIRPARTEDAPGVVEVLTKMGWKTATAEQRASWYKANPYIDFIAISGNEVLGYIHAVPFIPETLDAMMRGKKRSWDIETEDILPYKKGRSYDLYTGIATRKDIPNHTHRAGFRLIAGFMTFLEELIQEGITIRHLYAVSAEVDGQRLSKSLGFVQIPGEEGDLFPRFVLDLEKSNSKFAERYREAKNKANNVSNL